MNFLSSLYHNIYTTQLSKTMMVKDYKRLMTDTEKLWTYYTKTYELSQSDEVKEQWQDILGKFRTTPATVGKMHLQRRVNAVVILYYQDFKYVQGAEDVLYDIDHSFSVNVELISAALDSDTRSRLGMIRHEPSGRISNNILERYNEIRDLDRNKICLIEMYLS